MFKMLISVPQITEERREEIYRAAPELLTIFSIPVVNTPEAAEAIARLKMKAGFGTDEHTGEIISNVLEDGTYNVVFSVIE